MLSWALLSGPLPVLLRLAGIGAAALLLALMVMAPRRGRTKAVMLAACALVAVVTTIIVADLARNEWKLFPDRLQPLIYVWAGVSVFAVTVVAVGGFLAPGMRRMLWSAAAAAVVVLACANQVNVIFAAYPTLADAVGARRFSYVALPEVVKRPPRLLADVGPLAMRWSPPPGLPRGGKLSSAPIPGSLSGFPARNAELYFPPAFFADPRPQLPVLILVPGQPGSPQDWLRGGKLVQILDEFARAHRGLAPVVVVVDGTGSPFGNPLCLDSRLGNAASYIARDVPAWIKANLAVDQEPQAWAVGGASYGEPARFSSPQITLTSTPPSSTYPGALSPAWAISLRPSPKHSAAIRQRSNASTRWICCVRAATPTAQERWWSAPMTVTPRQKSAPSTTPPGLLAWIPRTAKCPAVMTGKCSPPP